MSARATQHPDRSTRRAPHALCALVLLGVAHRAPVAEASSTTPLRQSAAVVPPARPDRDEAVRWLRLQPVSSPHELLIETSIGSGDSPGEAVFRARTAPRSERGAFRLGLAPRLLALRGLGLDGAAVYSAYFEGGFGWTRAEADSRVMLDDENAFGWSTLGAELFGLCSQTGMGFDGISWRLTPLADDVGRATRVRVAAEPARDAAATADDVGVTIAWDLDEPRDDSRRPTNWYDATVRLRHGLPTLERMTIEVWGAPQGASSAGAATEQLLASSRIACSRWFLAAGRALPAETEQVNTLRRPDDQFVSSAAIARVTAARECELEEFSTLRRELCSPPPGTSAAWVGVGFEGTIGSAAFTLAATPYAGNAPLVELTPLGVWSLLEGAARSGADREVEPQASRPHPAESTNESLPPPASEIDRARSMDFGTVDLVDGKAVLRHDFPLEGLRSKGDVKGIRTTCGCSRAECIETPEGALALRVVLELRAVGPRDARVALLTEGDGDQERVLTWFSVQATARSALQCFPLVIERATDDTWRLHYLVRSERPSDPPEVPQSWRALTPTTAGAAIRHWIGTQVLPADAIDGLSHATTIDGIGPVVLPKGLRSMLEAR